MSTSLIGIAYDLVADVFLGEEDTPRKLGMNKGGLMLN